MILFLFFLVGFIFVLLLFDILIFSSIKIKVKNLKIDNSKIKEGYELNVLIYFLNKIPIYRIKLNSNKLKKIQNSKRFKRIKAQNFHEIIPSIKDLFKLINYISIEIQKLNLNLSIGTENAVTTSYLTAIIASIIGILITKLSKRNIDKCKFTTNPLYNSKNEYSIRIDGIFCIKIVHIINGMLNLTKKGSSDRYERASNRRSYAYRYE